MTKQELDDLFYEYLNRKCKDDEYTLHLKKNYDNFKEEISKCSERIALLESQGLFNKSNVPTNTKIAILLCGHVRKNNILNSISKFAENFNIDTFVFTWDNVGIKGSETNLNDTINYGFVENEIKKLPNLKKYEIKNNKEFISQIKENDFPYFNYSSPEVFIKSQLYSIKRCYELFESYVKKTNEEYSIILKTRFDMEFVDINLSLQVLQDIKNNKIIFTPNQGCGHSHPDHGTSCYVCDKMYYSYSLKNVHIFEHSNIVCDTFAYGNKDSMKDYCFLFDHYDRINKDFVKDNLKFIEKNKIPYELKNNVYNLDVSKSLVSHLNSLYYVNCSYPERLLQKHLREYMLIESRNIKMNFKR